jgi:hypothetical protein
MTPEQFRNHLRTLDPDDVVEQFLVNDDPGPFTDREALDHFVAMVRAKFGFGVDVQVSTRVVGSAKLGFAMLEKPERGGFPRKPAYRRYQPGESDIDVAVVSSSLYDSIWNDLARHAAKQMSFPWRVDLGDYMLSGWIRPDKFPPQGPQRCADWQELFNEVSRSEYFLYKRLRCGIYRSDYFLKLYQRRGVALAREQEERRS